VVSLATAASNKPLYAPFWPSCSFCTGPVAGTWSHSSASRVASRRVCTAVRWT
jgi:hypothetical protein